ncbi:MAG: methyltransferase domain-containing protein [Erysipelotrichaceae bacterium]|nr:methyltransferase domain-containing protein [Erysipelotrichaceae bacterium]
MKKEGYYSSGQFASLAQVTLRTIRFYDQKGLLKPSFVNENGARFYTDEDLVKLQQILLLKFLGFSLDEIKELIVNDADPSLLMNSLSIQRKLVKDRIEQMQLVDQAIEDTSKAILENHKVDWKQMLNLIHLTGVEKSLKSQYQDASNISARIQLHEKYSVNPQGWFPWVYEQGKIKEGMRILEIGCGDGTLWKQNSTILPKNLRVVLSDTSEGMVREARRQIPKEEFDYLVFDCSVIPYPDDSFDLIIANHVLFYCADIEKVIREVHRVLKPKGSFVCSTYGKHHMKEITELVQKFDERVVLSSDSLVNRFGKENGASILSRVFDDVVWKEYEDYLDVNSSEALISYILSCHGNQNEHLLPRYHEFSEFVRSKTKNGLRITKEAGIFLTKK